MVRVREPLFTIGDVVKLASGGPDMAVQELLSDYGAKGLFNGNYRAQWFAGKKLEHGTFAEETLTMVREAGTNGPS